MIPLELRRFDEGCDRLWRFRCQSRAEKIGWDGQDLCPGRKRQGIEQGLVTLCKEKRSYFQVAPEGLLKQVKSFDCDLSIFRFATVT
jgi:hypothetical protein